MRAERIDIYNYHRIRATPDLSTQFDDGVYSSTADEFQRDLRRLRSDTDVLSENDLIDILHGKIRMPRRAGAVTFDDGYVDNYEVAYPLLRGLGVPAIFFVPTQAISERKLGWWDRIACFVKQKGGSLEQTRRLQTLVKTDRSRPIEVIVESLRMELGAEEPSFDAQTRELMTWDQIRELSRPPYAVGSHTHTHRILKTLSTEEQRFELSFSKAILEEKLGGPVRSLAYPVGEYAHFGIEAKELARECGYQLGFSFLTGSNDSLHLDPWDVKRVAPPVRRPMVTQARRWLKGARDHLTGLR